MKRMTTTAMANSTARKKPTFHPAEIGQPAASQGASIRLGRAGVRLGGGLGRTAAVERVLDSVPRGPGEERDDSALVCHEAARVECEEEDGADGRLPCPPGTHVRRCPTPIRLWPAQPLGPAALGQEGLGQLELGRVEQDTHQQVLLEEQRRNSSGGVCESERNCNVQRLGLQTLGLVM